MLTLAPTQRQSARLEKPGRHAVVIGSGLGGLAVAIRLGARGYRVTVLEKLDGPGVLCCAKILDKVVPHAALL